MKDGRGKPGRSPVTGHEGQTPMRKWTLRVGLVLALALAAAGGWAALNAAALKAADPAARVLAVRLALHPDIKMRADLVPLLGDPAAEVRRAALCAVAAVADGEPLVGDEELFRWLHDPDGGVRKACHDALV